MPVATEISTYSNGVKNFSVKREDEKIYVKIESPEALGYSLLNQSEFNEFIAIHKLTEVK